MIYVLVPGAWTGATTWTFKTIQGGHWPMLTIPDQLADLLDAISHDD